MKKSNELEMKIYEKLGIRIFRKMAFGLYYVIWKPIYFIRERDKEERKRLLKRADNYNMRKGNGMQDLRDFKKMLLFNAGIHTFLIGNAIFDFVKYMINGAPLFVNFMYTIPILLNGYCIMLQRYNQLRINKVLEKGEKVEARKKVVLCEELKKDEFLSKVESYTLINTKKKEEIPITFDEFLNESSLQELKSYRKSLEHSKNFYNYLQENNISTSDDIMLHIDYDRTLKLELKK